MSDDKEVTTPDDPKVSMMYWHERAMAAEAALASERAKPTIKTQLQQAQESYERQAEPVAWMVGNDPMTAATYNAGDKEKAFDAAKRWNWSITGLSVIAGAPDFDINYQQAEPVALHIDPITPDDRKRYYDFEKYADHLPTCKQPRGDQFCECGYSAVRTNLSDLLDELAAPAQQEPPQQSAEPDQSAIIKEYK